MKSLFRILLVFALAALPITARAAQGDVFGTLNNSTAAVGTTLSATGSITVAVGDLIIAVYVENVGSASGFTSMADNLSNTYTAQNAGGSGSAVAGGKMYYSRVTNAGTLTTVTSTQTASGNHAALAVAVITGPFVVSPIDVNPANTSDTASPWTCPATGTLSQANETVVCWGSRAPAGSQTGAWTATSPLLLAVQTSNVFSSFNINVAIGTKVVTATTTTTPQFTSGTSANALTGLASFKFSVVPTGGNNFMLLGVGP